MQIREMPIVVSAGRQLFLSSLLVLAITPGAHAQLLGALSETEEIELGARAAEAVEADLELLTDDLVTAYVSELGQELAIRSARSSIAYHFKVVNTNEINAFALPGGFTVTMASVWKTGTPCCSSSRRATASKRFVRVSSKTTMLLA
jgi:predicted Zn-dependent protease